jgi:hypothetical protein
VERGGAGFPEGEMMWGFVGRHSGVHATWSRCSL